MHTKKFIEKLIFENNKSYENAIIDLDFLRLEKDEWEKIEKISIDYAIIEKLKTFTWFHLKKLVRRRKFAIINATLSKR